MAMMKKLLERIKNMGKKQPSAVVEEKPRASIVLPIAGKPVKGQKVGDYIERGVDEAAVLTARVRAVAHNDLDMLQSSAELKLDHSWANILDEKV